jgi:hypothetical protein
MRRILARVLALPSNHGEFAKIGLVFDNICKMTPSTPYSHYCFKYPDAKICWQIASEW